MQLKIHPVGSLLPNLAAYCPTWQPCIVRQVNKLKILTLQIKFYYSYYLNYIKTNQET